jgi:hypothetical protein
MRTSCDLERLLRVGGGVGEGGDGGGDGGGSGTEN